MADFLKMDIFFAVTTAVVVLLGSLVCVLLYYLIKVVRDISDITAQVKHEAQEIVDDVREVREDIKDGIAAAKTYTKKAVAGASIVRGISNLMQAFAEAQSETTPRKKRASTRAHKEEE